MDTTSIPPLFDKVAEAMSDAHLVAWDGCHKIYLALDEIEAKWFSKNGYYVFSGSANQMLGMVIGWWNDSCFLKFVSGVRHNEEDPNAGFVSLIPQGWESEYEDDEDEEDEECICDIPWTGMEPDCPAC